ncbi:hypothetical protein [Comamonas endophytica]|uniref:Uncharacterized protein n=1 Tax=Comamonas endophytica TaxID=2949090 RepID=A0ABY6G7A6_9BURK|nr:MULTISPECIES: hypothetical protein [unclassified Acidovorax]MCD2511529.1 hypothetical protein [Acidovorax sp. D4N7]UYG50915.1 hypothetical protein M9799_12550 [Acidovorax sp. 5MLIR]
MFAMLRMALGTATASVPVAESHVPARAAENPWRLDSRHSAYWPQHELDSFMLQMAGHGHAVNSAMMLGDIGYARQQLATAIAIGCPKLRALSARLSAYFDHPPCACSIETH